MAEMAVTRDNPRRAAHAIALRGIIDVVTLGTDLDIRLIEIVPA
ncbi:hypothetical protein [Mycobacterium sp. D16R24]|nr:hypothetical protein [Mycobacterium sp. D16R24]